MKIYLRSLIVVSLAFLPSPAMAEQEPKLLEQILQAKIVKTEALVADKFVVRAVEAQNAKMAHISKDEIASEDSKWIQSKAGDVYDQSVIKGYLSNDCSEFLKKFQQENPGFKEIFITDAKGLNVCQTNKTSDFYQADEEWWTRAFENGKGASYFGQMAYDESARSESYPIMVPVRDPATGKAIGVGKAVISFTSLVDEL